MQGFFLKKLHVLAMHKGYEATAILCIISDCYLQGFQMIPVACNGICKGFKQSHVVLIVQAKVFIDSAGIGACRYVAM